MLPRWYDPILIVGVERTLPSKIASLLAALGVDIRPFPLHKDATMCRWEDEELRHCQMAVLGEQISLCTFNLRVAILSEQRRRGGRHWGMASAYSADVLVPMLSHYLNPLVIWCQCAPDEAVQLLLDVQPPVPGWDASDAMNLCLRRQQALTRWLDGYQMFPLDGHGIVESESGIIDQIVTFCGLSPSPGQLYQATSAWASQRKDRHGKEKKDGGSGQAVRQNGSGVPRQQVSS